MKVGQTPPSQGARLADAGVSIGDTDGNAFARRPGVGHKEWSAALGVGPVGDSLPVHGDMAAVAKTASSSTTTAEVSAVKR